MCSQHWLTKEKLLEQGKIPLQEFEAASLSFSKWLDNLIFKRRLEESVEDGSFYHCYLWYEMKLPLETQCNSLSTALLSWAPAFDLMLKAHSRSKAA